ncbi:MAG: hypothetical protein ACREL4_06235 [Gemmatimonadales bacterium]
MRAWTRASRLAPTAIPARRGPLPQRGDVPDVTLESMAMSGLFVVTRDRVNPDKDQ